MIGIAQGQPAGPVDDPDSDGQGLDDVGQPASLGLQHVDQTVARHLGFVAGRDVHVDADDADGAAAGRADDLAAAQQAAERSVRQDDVVFRGELKPRRLDRGIQFIQHPGQIGRIERLTPFVQAGPVRPRLQPVQEPVVVAPGQRIRDDIPVPDAEIGPLPRQFQPFLVDPQSRLGLAQIGYVDLIEQHQGPAADHQTGPPKPAGRAALGGPFTRVS